MSLPTPNTRSTLLLSASLATLLLAGCNREAGDAAPVVMPTQPAAVDTPPPEYPVELACQDVGGTVGLILKIGTDGAPTDIRVENSSGHPQLDSAAAEAVTDWVFRPGTRGGSPVETDLRVPVTFTPPVERPDACFQLEDAR